MISKTKIIKILEEFYKIHKSLGNNIKAVQYLNAINSIKISKINKIINANKLIELPSIGKGIVSKINEYIKTGKIKVLDEFKSDPIVLAHINLTSIFGIGPKKAKELISHNIFSVNQLKKNKKIKLTNAQKIGLKYYNDLIKKIPRKEVEKVKSIMEKEFKSLFPDGKVILAGSYRLGKKESGDIDIILTSKNKNILNIFIAHLFKKNILIDSLSSRINKNNYMGIIKIGDLPARHIDLHFVKKELIPFHLLYFGSGERFSRSIRKLAKEKGYKLSNKGLYKGTKSISINTERNIFDKLKIKWIPPEKRDISDLKNIT